MDSPTAPTPAAHQQDYRTKIARLALMFTCAHTPRSAEFAQRKLCTFFGVDLSEADLRAAHQALPREASDALTGQLRRGQP